MLKDMKSRMKSILDPECDTFNPLPASATLLDPTMAKLCWCQRWKDCSVLLRGTSLGNADMSPKHPPPYLQMLGVQANPPALKRFKYLATKLSAIAPDQESASGLGNCTDTVQGQLNRYIAEFELCIIDDALGFWAARRSSHNLLAPLGCTSLTSVCRKNFLRMWPYDHRKT